MNTLKLKSLYKYVLHKTYIVYNKLYIIIKLHIIIEFIIYLWNFFNELTNFIVVDYYNFISKNIFNVVFYLLNN